MNPRFRIDKGGARLRRALINSFNKVRARQSLAPPEDAGFTLLEVMIACAIFFMCAFAILGVVTQGLSGARALQTKEPDAGLLLAALLNTNRLVLEEGVESGDFEDLFPDVYPDYSWIRESIEKYSNGLWEVTFVITKGGRGKRSGFETRTTTYIYCPTCPPGSATKGGM